MNLTGRWRIVEMDLWDLEAIDLMGPASRRDRRQPLGRRAPRATRMAGVGVPKDCCRIVAARHHVVVRGHVAIERRIDAAPGGHAAHG